MSSTASNACGPAPALAIYPDLKAAFTAVQEHVKANGYAFYRHDKKLNRAVFRCDRGGKYRATSKNPDTDPSKQRLSTSLKKSRCKMGVELRLDHISGNWSLSVLEATHNHDRSADPKAYPAYRIAALKPNAYAAISTLGRAGLSTSQILSTLRIEYPEALLTAKDVTNILQKSRLEELDGKTLIQWLVEELQSKGFNP
ncbi:hypothetical protein M430DRAFT_69958 [Amorphotheca resinae ATCC 22711]|uniref:FAR1 domain-containing protein n=1 Tax=Amorphotheca resinae ATCC 22711 TaxID=857342 RepID=A0A2T3AR24_AMORE|nr:hypothetical protein M430DRAFT_69958 [Amorphotheca resinae ATCC 22711]PSS08718.1 hypothetical protein M430DRAFT_69958 [Amorphotheca resinae ATCC 22711]